MKPHRTVVERGDTYELELNIRVYQDEGYYEYFPVAGDKISVYVKQNNKVITEERLHVYADMEERVRINVPTQLPAGDYTYDVVISCADGEKHTICDEYILKIKEDSTHA